jgi:hypothetical protein
MAAFSGVYTTLAYDAARAMPLCDAGYRVYSIPFSHTHPDDAGTGAITLFRLPPGRIKLLSTSNVQSSELGTGATIAIGYGAGQWKNGKAISSSVAGLVAATLADDGGIDELFPEFEPEGGTSGGIDIIATVASGDIEENDTISGQIHFVYFGA